jgi:hypothetical protein
VPFKQVPLRHGHVFGVLGRLKQGESLETARAELDVVGKRMQQSFPHTHTGHQPRAEALKDELLGPARQALGALLLSALLLLVIACTNVAHFQLARVIERESGSAVRAALGASRWQVARPFVAEGLLLAMTGGLLGTALAPGYFKAAGVRIYEGRAFTDADDATHPGAAIVNRSLARLHFGEDFPTRPPTLPGHHPPRPGRHPRARFPGGSGHYWRTQSAPEMTLKSKDGRFLGRATGARALPPGGRGPGVEPGRAGG